MGRNPHALDDAEFHAVAVGFGGFVALIALLIYTGIVAGKAAKSVDDQPDDRHRQ